MLQLMSRLSVRQRLTLTIACLTSLALVTVGVTLYALEAQRINRDVDRSLSQEIGEFRNFQQDGIDPKTGTKFASADRLLKVFLERNLPDENEVLHAFRDPGVTTYQGEENPVLQNAPAFAALVERLKPSGGTETLELEGTTYRIAVQPVKQGKSVSALVISHDVSASRSDLRELLITYALLAALSVILITGLASWLTGRLLSPVRRLRDTARGITDGDLGGRLEVTGNDDLSDLQRTFNDMLDRLESAFVTQRQLLDDAGHELRSPLTVLRGHLEVLDTSDPQDVAATRILLLDEIDRMSRLVGDLLILAKARRPDFVDPHPCDVESLTHGFLDRSRALADRSWVLDGVARATAELDGQRITQAMLQLADNAAKHTQPGDEIGIGSRVHDGRVEFWVRDTGPGVDTDVRATLFERFARSERNDEGFGLGLSIVNAIAAAHGGMAELDDTPVGTTIRIRLGTEVAP